MSVDWAADVYKYEPNADAAAIAGIIRHCGVALRTRDASLVAYSDPAELATVREKFLKKKLALTDSDEALDAAIAAVGTRLAGVQDKHRVTVYYLLAEHYGKLPVFYTKARAGAAGTAAAADAGLAGAGLAGAAALGAAGLGGEALGGLAPGAALNDGGLPVTGTAGNAGSETSHAAGDAVGAAGAATAGLAGAATAGLAGAAMAGVSGLGAAASGAAAAAPIHAATTPPSGNRQWLWLILALVAIGIILWALTHCTGPAAQTPAPLDAASASSATPTAPVAATASAAAAPTAAIPTGAGVTSETIDGKPKVNVYFASGKADVVDAFGPAATALKAYVDGHAGSGLAVSGYADKTGNAAFNAALAKTRAGAVKDALVKAGLADSAVALVKPADATGAATDNAGARRVEVTVK